MCNCHIEAKGVSNLGYLYSGQSRAYHKDDKTDWLTLLLYALVKYQNGKNAFFEPRCTTFSDMDEEKLRLIKKLKDFDFASESNVGHAVSIVAETIGMAYVKTDLEELTDSEKMFCSILKSIRDEPKKLDLEKISTSSEMLLAIVEEILAYFKRYEFGIEEMENIVRAIKF